MSDTPITDSFLDKQARFGWRPGDKSYPTLLREFEREINNLKRWKEEAFTVGKWWTKIDEYVRKHPDVVIGESVSDAALRLLELGDALKEALDTIQNRLEKIRCPKNQTQT